jgi:uncharacterized membrane protein YtjA (UPF0391 family)
MAFPKYWKKQSHCDLFAPQMVRHENCLAIGKHNRPIGSVSEKEVDAGVRYDVLPIHPDLSGEPTMFRTALGLGVVFLVIALIAGLFGFGLVSADSWLIAKVFFFVFVVLAVLSIVSGFFFRTRTA